METPRLIDRWMDRVLWMTWVSRSKSGWIKYFRVGVGGMYKERLMSTNENVTFPGSWLK